jgi:hypothetical protein
MEKTMEFLSRFGFGTASLVLMAMSLALVGFALTELYGAVTRQWGEVGDALLDAIGYVVIAMAVFDLAKYFVAAKCASRPKRGAVSRSSCPPFRSLSSSRRW